MLTDEQRELKNIACLSRDARLKETASYTYQVQPADVAAALKNTLRLQEQDELAQAHERFSTAVDQFHDRILFTELWSRAQTENAARAAMDAWNALDLLLEDNVAANLESALAALEAALASKDADRS